VAEKSDIFKIAWEGSAATTIIAVMLKVCEDYFFIIINNLHNNPAF